MLYTIHKCQPKWERNPCRGSSTDFNRVSVLSKNEFWLFLLFGTSTWPLHLMCFVFLGIVGKRTITGSVLGNNIKTLATSSRLKLCDCCRELLSRGRFKRLLVVICANSRAIASTDGEDHKMSSFSCLSNRDALHHYSLN